MKQKRVLVTGAAGFIGRYVAREYHANGYEVIGVGHGQCTEEEQRAWGIDDWHESDVVMESLQSYATDCAVIVHCAGSGSVGFSVQHPMEDFERTVWTTHYVLEYIRTCSPDTVLVYPSSAAVYGVQEALPLTVNMIPNPISPYGVHKKIVEELCKMYGKQYGVSSVVLRLFSIYGEGLKKQLLWDTCEKIRQGKNEFWGTGEETRDWVHASDMARAMLLAAKKASLQVPIVNLASGSRICIREIVSELYVSMENKIEPYFGGEIDVGNPQHYLGDVETLMSWGWMPKMGIQRGLEAYVKWYRGIA